MFLFPISWMQVRRKNCADGFKGVYVPGSQFWFVDPETGRLKTTAAGKASGGGGALAGKGVTSKHEAVLFNDR